MKQLDLNFDPGIDFGSLSIEDLRKSLQKGSNYKNKLAELRGIWVGSGNRGSGKLNAVADRLIAIDKSLGGDRSVAISVRHENGVIIVDDVFDV